MAGILTTKECRCRCRCCHRKMTLSDLWFAEADEFGPGTWLCINAGTCVHHVENITMTNNAITILNGLLDCVDTWMFSDYNGTEPRPWDTQLAWLASHLELADKAKVDALIAKMDAKGMTHASAMLKPEGCRHESDHGCCPLCCGEDHHKD